MSSWRHLEQPQSITIIPLFPALAARATGTVTSVVGYCPNLVPESARLSTFYGARMLLAKFPLDGRGALYEQLARVLKRAIVEGHFHPGERLPATRALAQMLNLSRNTVLTAYEILRAEQLTVSNERSGTRVAEISLPPGFTSPPVAAPPQSRYAARLRKLGTQSLGRIREDLRYNLHADPPFVGDMMRSWSRKLAAASRVAGAHYPEAQGFQPLRVAIADYLARR